jgi:hypothetical protein
MSKIQHDQILPLDDALYEAQCPECDEIIYWEADFDADGTTSYFGECCNKRFRLYSASVRVSID